MHFSGVQLGLDAWRTTTLSSFPPRYSTVLYSTLPNQVLQSGRHSLCTTFFTQQARQGKNRSPIRKQLKINGSWSWLPLYRY